jgi:ribosomal protein S12 methylthiotransferase
VSVLVEVLEFDADEWPVAIGRSGHQGPDDGSTTVRIGDVPVRVGDIIVAEVCDSEGVDLIARIVAEPAG